MLNTLDPQLFRAATPEEIDARVTRYYVPSPKDKSLLRDILHNTHAVLKGHYPLRTEPKPHSEWFISFVKVSSRTTHLHEVARMMVDLLPAASEADVVLSAASAAVLCGFAVAEHIGGPRFLSADIEAADPTLSWLGNLRIAKGDKVLVVTDVVTTGRGMGQLVKVARDDGGQVIGALTFACRFTGGTQCLAEFMEREHEVPRETVRTLIDFDIPRWKAEDCPLCKRGVPLVSSRPFAGRPGDAPAATGPQND